MKARLAILGSYPPPYGGVATHVMRLSGLLEARRIEHVIYNAVSASVGPNVVSVAARRRSWLLDYSFRGEERGVYVLSDRLSAWLAGAFMQARGRRVAVRLRNSALPDLMKRGGMNAHLAAFALRNIETVVCVSRALAQTAREVGVRDEQILHQPGFLPPTRGPDDERLVADAVWRFAREHTPLIVANGKVGRYAGEDLYGLDHLVELAARLRPDLPDVGIVVCFWDHKPNEQGYLDGLMRRARDLGVGGAVYFNTRPGPFVPVLAHAQLFVRPTNTDGDANSVREALYLGVPAVASDVVERPAGARTFRTRDVDDFEAKVREALAGGRQEPLAPAAEDEQGVSRYLSQLAALTTAI